ncbi:MAG: ABC transporter ATP-binding protein, partial [Myxococcales bacterium]|nr:ABC transporter ATP-binding protein [Myxococcales bacterium]
MSWRVAVEAQVGGLSLAVELAGDERPTAIVGPNGAGKTTLLRIIAGAVRPARGHITIGGRPVLDSARGLDLPPEARCVGYVPQGYGLFPHLRVIDNVAFGLSFGSRKLTRAARRRSAAALLEALECGHLAERSPRELSGGEAQRVALARALVVEPQLLLMDEPLAALDAPARRALRRFLAAHLRRRERPSIVVTHDPRDVLALDAIVCVLEAGRVVQQGAAAELQRAPASEFVA